MHERIKSLHDSGKGYRTIAKLLNAEGSRTAKNKEWKNKNGKHQVVQHDEKYTIEYDNGKKETLNLGDWCRRQKIKEKQMMLQAMNSRN